MNAYAAFRPVDPDAPTEGLVGQTGVFLAESLMRRVAAGTRGGKAAEMGLEALDAGGGRMRLRLALAAAEALGVDREEAAPWAAACELLHNASLVHDDLQDGDTVRRDRPTVWSRHGVAQAVNAGDLLLMAPFLALGSLAVSGEVRWRLTRLVAEAAEAAVRGQADELELTASRTATWEAWTRAAEGKTSPLLALPVAGAAVLAGLADRSAAALGRPFGQIGLAYQLQDDLLDLGPHKRRPPGADLRNGRITSVVAAFVALRPEQAPELLGFLADPAQRARPERVADVIGWLHASGAVAEVRRRVNVAAEQVRQDSMLRAVPDLHELACACLDHVLAAGGGAR